MSETAVPMTSSLSPRANIARLTLQLRAAQREADEAERAEQEWDGDAVAAELRSRLEPMLREQQRAFELELWRARAAAAARVATVRQELDAARRESEAAAADQAAAEQAAASERAAAARAAAEELAAERAAAERAAAERVAAEELAAAERAAAERAAAERDAAEQAALDAIDAEVIEVDAAFAFAPPEPASEVTLDDTLTHTSGSEDPDDDHESPHVVGTSHEPAVGTRSGRDGNDWSRPAPEQPVPVTADDVRSIVDEAIERFAARQAAQSGPGMDPEAFSRAFAAAFGAAFSAMLDDRIAALNAGPAVAPPWVRYPAPMQVEVKKSFWTNMWHADVMLSVLAAVIVLVILIAWST